MFSKKNITSTIQRENFPKNFNIKKLKVYEDYKKEKN